MSFRMIPPGLLYAVPRAGARPLVARGRGFPVLVRPSYALGDRYMAIAYDEEIVRRYMREAGVHSGDSSCVLSAYGISEYTSAHK
jgi:hypothetical protein